MKRVKNEGKKKKFRAFMQNKLLAVFSIIILVMLALMGRLLYINQKDHEKYEKKVLSQQSYVSATIPYQRGSILDRNGTVLAASKKVFNVIFDPKVILTNDDYQEPTIQALCDVFSLKPMDLNNTLKEKANSSYVIIAKEQTYDLVSQFEKMQSANKNIKGVWFEEQYIRSYPYDSLASHVIGYVSNKDVGTWGIEQYYNSILNGTNGRTYGYYDSELNLVRTTKPAVNGATIVSTIDANIQSIVEKHIDTFMQEMGADNIGVMIANPNNGEIYAMASNNSFNLNDPYDLKKFYTEDEIKDMSEEEKIKKLNHIWRNFCISDTYEPGSTFKPFTVAAALEENLVTPETTFTCNGYLMVDKWRIKCNATHGTVTLAQALMKSCNPSLMEIGKRLGPHQFTIYQDLFNFGKKTGIDLPGEEEGIIFDEKDLNVVELATSSFGQSFNVTMPQMVAGFSSLINGGYYYQPKVVKEIVSDQGAIIDDKPPVVVNETVSEKTTDFLREALYLTVDQGTAKPAKVAGYLVGGKTGTAQKQPRDAKTYVVSFIGCVPSDDPQVVIYVVIDEVHNEQKKASSSVATALTSKILKDILPFLEIYPEGDIEYSVDLPVKEDNLVDEQGNPITPSDEPFTESEAEAIPETTN